jgi:hypothetical protein
MGQTTKIAISPKRRGVSSGGFLGVLLANGPDRDHRRASSIGDILLVSQSITLPLSEDLRQTDLILFVPACLAIILEHAQVSFHLPSTIALLFVCFNTRCCVTVRDSHLSSARYYKEQLRRFHELSFSPWHAQDLACFQNYLIGRPIQRPAFSNGFSVQGGTMN